MIKFARRILIAASKFIPFVGPIRRASGNIKEAAPVAFSPAGRPHLILASIVPFTLFVGGLLAGTAGAGVCLIFEIIVLRPKFAVDEQGYKLANCWAIIHGMAVLVIIQTAWLLP